MDKQSNGDDASFEAGLRQLTACIGSLSVEETFYQAGWNAARRVSVSSRRRGVSGFVVGIVCGLACSAVGLQMWVAQDMRGEAPAGAVPVVNDQQSVELQETVTADAGGPDRAADVPAASDAGSLDELFALVSPGHWFHVAADLRQSPLAAGSSERMTRGVRMDTFRSLARVSDVPPTAATEATLMREQVELRGSLRTFPLSPEALDEWL